MQTTIYKTSCLCIIISLIAGCSTSKLNGSTNTNLKPILPKVPKTNIPMGNTENWRYIGTTDDNQIVDEIDNSSIKAIHNQAYKFLDRKTIVDPNSFNYVEPQSSYKFAIGLWTINCTEKKYLLNQMKIYDIYGNLIKSYDYTTEDSVKWLIIGTKTIAEMQYQYVCLGNNQNLGY